MTRHGPLPDDASRQADQLDAFLDQLVNRDPVPPPDLDPSLATIARHVQALASDSVTADTRRADKARRWEHLMQTLMNPSVVTPFPGSRTLPPSAPMPVALRSDMKSSRLRRWGDGSLGLVATLTLVLLVAASSLAVYLSAPQGGDEPTMLPAAFGATPALPLVGGPENPRVILQPCDAEPMGFDSVMNLLTDWYYPDAGEVPMDIERLGAPLPEGPSPDQATINGLTFLTGRYLGCQLSVLRMAQLSSHDGIVQLFTAQFDDGGFSLVQGPAILQAWLDSNAEPPMNLGTGSPGPFVLADLRSLDDGRVAGYLSRTFLLDAEGNVVSGKNGYIVFVQVDGQWLIDEFRPAPQG